MKKEMVMDREAPHLPLEIITIILKRLPVKSLIRFQCVCKDWYGLIKSPSFIAEHRHHHATHRNPSLLFERMNPRCLCSINPDDMQVVDYQIPPFAYSSMCRIVPSSNNDLVCFELRDTGSFCVWNPAAREVCHVTRAPRPLRGGQINVGFGFSPVVNDYKIVRIYSYNKVGVEVFSLRRRSWKTLDAAKLKGMLPMLTDCGFTFDGAIFWLCIKRTVEKEERGIVSFDIATEVFKLIPFPISALKSNYSRLTTYDNKLAMLSHNNVNNKKPSSIDLWVMNKCTDASGDTCIWTKVYTSNLYPGLLHPVTVWGDEIVCKVNEKSLLVGGRQVVLKIDDDESRLVFCNLRTNEFKEFVKCSFMTPIWNYSESLVSDTARRSPRIRRKGLGSSRFG